MMPVWVSYVMTAIGVVPLAGTALARRRAGPWWWFAGAFAVSAVADIAGALKWGMVSSQTYLVLQAGVFAMLLARPKVAVGVIAGLAAVSSASLYWRQGQGLDLVLHVTAFVTLAVLAWRSALVGPLRTTLTWGFALMAVTWVWVWSAKSFEALGAYQAVRLGMALGFVYAVQRRAA